MEDRYKGWQHPHFLSSAIKHANTFRFIIHFTHTCCDFATTCPLTLRNNMSSTSSQKPSVQASALTTLQQLATQVVTLMNIQSYNVFETTASNKDPSYLRDSYQSARTILPKYNLKTRLFNEGPGDEGTVDSPFAYMTTQLVNDSKTSPELSKHASHAARHILNSAVSDIWSFLGGKSLPINPGWTTSYSEDESKKKVLNDLYETATNKQSFTREELTFEKKTARVKSKIMPWLSPDDIEVQLAWSETLLSHCVSDEEQSASRA